MMHRAGKALETVQKMTANAVRGYDETSTDLLDTLGALRLIELAVEQARAAVVVQAREDRYTWQEIGDALGVSRQAVQQRYPM